MNFVTNIVFTIKYPSYRICTCMYVLRAPVNLCEVYTCTRLTSFCPFITFASVISFGSSALRSRELTEIDARSASCTRFRKRNVVRSRPPHDVAAVKADLVRLHAPFMVSLWLKVVKFHG